LTAPLQFTFTGPVTINQVDFEPVPFHHVIDVGRTAGCFLGANRVEERRVRSLL